MTPLPLQDDFSFGLERQEKNVRLIVYQYGNEYVCRKERFSVLERFIESDTAHLFRGRLQLYKYATGIGIAVKGTILGSVDPDDFKSRLAALKTLEFPTIK